MPRALWNGAILAESGDTIVVEESPTQSVCPWKGTASYFHVVVDGQKNEDAAWYYPDPKEGAERLGIKGYVAFWRGVEVEA